MHAPGAIPRPWWLPAGVLRPVDALVDRMLMPAGTPRVDFSAPAGEAALFAPDSVAWRVYRNPVALFIGGVTAVILELAEPAVRTGVWEHSSFRRDPMRRLQRTGLAAMVTVYGPRSQAERMIGGVVRMHERVRGTTPAGEAYQANERRLLTWVQATASYSFSEAYHRYVQPLSAPARDRFYAESAPGAALHGAVDAPRNAAQLQALFEAQRERLEPSPIVFEFLQIMGRAPVLPAPLRPAQGLLLRAAVSMTPDWVRERLGLGPRMGLQAWQRPLVRGAAQLAERVLLPSGPAVQASLRLGLPPAHLLQLPDVNDHRTP
jgi:uncharacterized protein (DUF2236 family)